MTERKKIKRLLSDYDEDRDEKVIVVRMKELDELIQQIDSLTTSRDNAVSMLKTVLQMLDSKTCL